METLHPRIRLVWAAGWLVTAVVLAAVLLAVGRFFETPWLPALVLPLLALGVAHALLRYRAWRFELQDDALYLERGVVTEVLTSVPYVRVQHVDTRRGPLERLLGLSRVVVYTAGSRGADVSVPGLSPERATALRERLRELAVESEFEDAT